MPEDDEQLRRLSARAEVADLLARYCRAVDRRDRAGVRACYHDDAVDEHGSFRGGPDEFVAWCFALLDRYDSTFHLLGQSLVEVDPGCRSARAETYGIAHHRRAGGPDHLNLVTGFRYLDHLERRRGRWGIVHRRAVADWSRVDREGDWWDLPADHLRGAPGPGDPSTRR